MIRAISMSLFCAALLVYVAAKIHFFTHYGEADYLEHHRTYWIALASAGLRYCMNSVAMRFAKAT